MIDSFTIAGIQQIGLGSEDFQQYKEWYAEMFQIDIRLMEDDSYTEIPFPLSGDAPQKRKACININIQGGGGLKICQHTERKPQHIAFDLQLGDLGIFIAKLKSSNISAYHEELSAKYKNISQIYMDPRGIPTFYLHDPAGNCFQIVEDNYIFMDDNKYSGGVTGASIGVSDMERSLLFYRDILGYDTILYDKTGIFSDWQTLRGGNRPYRRILLARSQPLQGSFSELYGNSTLELVQALDRTPRKIYEDRCWGDPGFIHVGFDIANMKEFERHCNQYNVKFFPNGDSSLSNSDMEQPAIQFAYIEDPDGTIIEFVEACRIPLIGSLNIGLDLRKYDRSKPLPKIFFQIMKLNKIKKQ